MTERDIVERAFLPPLVINRMHPDCAPKGAPVLVAGGIAMKKTGDGWFSGMSEPPFTRPLSWDPQWWAWVPQDNALKPGDAADEITALRARVTELEAELGSEDQMLAVELEDAEQQNEADAAEIARLREALTFYADQWVEHTELHPAPFGNGTVAETIVEPSEALCEDGGETARAALADAPAQGWRDTKIVSLSHLADAIVEERTRRSLGLREAAREAGMSPTTLSRIQTGEKPEIETLLAICRWLGVTHVALASPPKTEGE